MARLMCYRPVLQLAALLLAGHSLVSVQAIYPHGRRSGAASHPSKSIHPKLQSTVHSAGSGSSADASRSIGRPSAIIQGGSTHNSQHGQQQHGKSCEFWGHKAVKFEHKLSHSSNEDLLYSINPHTGREAEMEDAAEAAIAAAAAKAGLQPLEYEENLDMHSDGSSSSSAASQHKIMDRHTYEAAQRFRLGYTLSVWFHEYHPSSRKHIATDNALVAMLTHPTTDNQTLLETFADAVVSAVSDVLPVGVAYVHAANVLPGEPLELDIVLYPDLTDAEHINPTKALMDTDEIISGLSAGSLSHNFLNKYSVSDVKAVPHSRNAQDITDCAELFPSSAASAYGSMLKSCGILVCIVAPLMLFVALAAHMMWDGKQLVAISGSTDLLQGSIHGTSRNCSEAGYCSASSSCGGAGPTSAGTAVVYALADYQGPYRSSYSSGGGSSNNTNARGAEGWSSSSGGGSTTAFEDCCRPVSPFSVYNRVLLDRDGTA